MTYARTFHRTHTAAVARALQEGTQVTVAGRLLVKRELGGVTFVPLLDGTGTIQLWAQKAILGARFDEFNELKGGDIVGASGPIAVTKRGEPSLEVHEFQLLTPALKPLPEKWHGLKDVETRYRQRHLDLITNLEVREVFITRSKVIAGLRRFLDERGFLEVETPILQDVPGGGLARPFTTHFNALHEDLYLRIALELHLKRLIVAGLDKVYEIGRVFRNEGLSPRHNPEFTLLETYEAYADYEDVMGMVEELLVAAAKAAGKGLQFTYQGEEVDLTPPYPRKKMVDLISEKTGIDVLQHADAEELTRIARREGVELETGLPWGFVVMEIYEKKVETALRAPVFVVDYPLDVSPLARKREDDPRFVERFELLVVGRELANAFTELTDPVDQRQRFQAQAAAAEAGALETHPMDEDFIEVLEQGMPPTGGLGIGVDRLVMLLTDQASIRDVLLFPHLRRAGLTV